MGNYNGYIANGGFSSLPDIKYYDCYTSTSTSSACNSGVCYGHALSETSSWYSDYASMSSSKYSWLLRGGGYSSSSSAGIFGFFREYGYNDDAYSFRLVLILP